MILVCYLFLVWFEISRITLHAVRVSHYMECDTNNIMKISFNLISSSSFTRQYNGISISLSLGHWCLSKIKTLFKYVISMIIYKLLIHFLWQTFSQMLYHWEAYKTILKYLTLKFKKVIYRHTGMSKRLSVKQLMKMGYR